MRETRPELGWTTAENLLANIEHEFRLWLWANNSKKSSKKPERIMPSNKQTEINKKIKNRKYGVAVDIDTLQKKFKNK